jgi:hypothetical protein
VNLHGFSLGLLFSYIIISEGFLCVMTEEKTVPLQHMQVTPGDENNYLVPGGIAGPSCLGVKSKVDYTSRLGVGRQADSLPHGNLNCGMGKVLVVSTLAVEKY